jgi:hypothetical protein
MQKALLKEAVLGPRYGLIRYIAAVCRTVAQGGVLACLLLLRLCQSRAVQYPHACCTAVLATYRDTRQPYALLLTSPLLRAHDAAHQAARSREHCIAAVRCTRLLCE